VSPSPAEDRCERLIEALGGTEVWAPARSVFYREQTYVTHLDVPVESRVWRSLDGPGERTRVVGDGIDRDFAWSERGGSGIREGEFYRFSDERMETELGFWPFHVYTMYHRLASGDPSLGLDLEGEHHLIVRDAASGVEVTRFSTTSVGEPIAWSATTPVVSVSYLYGPLRAFGRVRVPRWGVTTDGVWRFELDEFELHEEPAPVAFEVAEP